MTPKGSFCWPKYIFIYHSEWVKYPESGHHIPKTLHFENENGYENDTGTDNTNLESPCILQRLQEPFICKGVGG